MKAISSLGVRSPCLPPIVPLKFLLEGKVSKLLSYIHLALVHLIAIKWQRSTTDNYHKSNLKLRPLIVLRPNCIVLEAQTGLALYLSFDKLK